MTKLWENAPNWLRWGSVTALLTVIILVGNVVVAWERITPFLPVSWGALQAWGDERDAVRSSMLMDLENRLVTKLTDSDWRAVIYRTKDLDFQISLLRGSELMLLTALESAEPGEFTRLRQQRLHEVQQEISEKTAELRTLICLVENRGNTSARC